MKSLFVLAVALAAGLASAQPIDLPEGPPVRHCGRVDCLSFWQNMPRLPDPPIAPAPVVTGVIAPTDGSGPPSEFVQVCDWGGCRTMQAPVAVVEYPPPPPPNMYWYQPPAYDVPKVILWGPMQGHGPWGLPSGPPLRRHR